MLPDTILKTESFNCQKLLQISRIFTICWRQNSTIKDIWCNIHGDSTCWGNKTLNEILDSGNTNTVNALERQLLPPISCTKVKLNQKAVKEISEMAVYTLNATL